MIKNERGVSMSKIANRVKQIICNHYGKDVIYWKWVYTLTGIREERIEIHYECRCCKKEVIAILTGQQAKDYATVMYAYEKKEA